MSQTINIPSWNPKNIVQHTQVAATFIAGVSGLDILNDSGITPNNYLKVGVGEKSEVLNPNTIISNHVNLIGVTEFGHKQYEPVLALMGNQFRIYRADNPADSSTPPDSDFSVLATSNLAPDQEYTAYTDPNGGSAYWYKFTWFNSKTSQESDLADSIAIRGGDLGHIVDVYAIKKDAGLSKNDRITDDWVETIRDEAENEAYTFLSQAGIQLPLTDIPPFLRLIVKRLAAGHLLLEQYQPGAINASTQIGQNKVDWAEKQLTAIANGKQTLVGIDYQGEPATAVGSISGYPNQDYTIDPYTADVSGLIDESPPFFIKEEAVPR